MVEGPIIERIDSDLEELMDRFFKSSQEDLAKMRAAIDAKDFETLTRLGHTAKGTGYGYGFKGMGDIGVDLENAAKIFDETKARVQIDRMAYYLENVTVEFGG